MSWGLSYEANQDDLLEYHSGGRKQFQDASDDDILRMVRDKWDEVERAAVKESFSDEDQFRDATKKINPIQPDHIEDVREMVAAPSIIATHWPIAAGIEAEPIAPDTAAAAVEAKQQRNNAALALLLMEL